MASTVGVSLVRDVAPCLSKLTSGEAPPVAPVRCLLGKLMDSLRLSGLVSYLPSQGLDDGPDLLWHNSAVN